MNRRQATKRLAHPIIRALGVAGVALVVSRCNKSNPVGPSSSSPTNNRIQPTMNYIRYGWTSGQMSLLSAIQEHNPILSSYQPAYDDYFVEGFQGTRMNRLVFYVDNQRYDDRGVSKKMLMPNQLWGVVQV